MGTYGTFTGVVRWYDADTQTGYILSLKDGEVQASMVGDGITAANQNILLDENGLVIHDLTNASVISPTLGVGPVSNRLGTYAINPAENFSQWTLVGTASVTANTAVCPTGIDTVADTVNLPATNDAVTCLTSAALGWTLDAGASAVFSVWLKAASSGTIQLTAATAGGSALADDVVRVTTEWRRVALTFTNSTGATAQIKIGIVRASAGQLAAVYAWGAQVVMGYDRLTPYWPNKMKSPIAATAIRGPLLLSTPNATFSVLIGTDWIDAPPTGVDVVAIGDSAGDGSTADQCVLIGHNAGTGSTAGETVSIGEEAGRDNTGDGGVFLGTSAGDGQSGNSVIGIGGYAGSSNTGSAVIGLGSYAGGGNSGNYVVALGSYAGTNNTGSNVVLAGQSAGQGNTQDHVIALGYSAGLNNAFAGVILLGNGATATAVNQIVLGSNSLEFTHLFGGGGVTQATPPAAFTVAATGGSGTNVAGTALKLAGGQGTGTGAGGAVVLQYAPAGGSGSSANALVDCLTINASGVAVKPGANSTTAIQMQNAAGTAVLTIDTTNARVNASTRYDIAGTQMLYKVGTHNYMVGPSGNATMSGDSNMMMGGGAGVSLTTGTGNVILGVNAMYYATGATSCLALGSNALQGVLSQTGVVGIGNGAGFTGPGNHGMLIGSGAGYYVTGARVIAIGGNAVRGAAGSTTADDVIGIGYESFTGVTTGGENVGVGSWTGVTTNPAYKTTTGLQNTYVGTYAGQASATQRNRAIALGYRAFVDADNTCVIGGTGFFRVKTVIGATTAAAVLDVVGGADELQIRVKGYSTQTANLQEWHNSSATVLASVGPLGQLIVNESGADADSRIEGDTDAYLTFWDASTDRVGVGTNAPGYKLDVAGGVNVSSGNVYRVNGTQVVTAQQAAIADTTNTADVGVQLNKVIAMLRVHGLIAT